MTNRYGTSATPDRPDFEISTNGEPLSPLVRADVIGIDVAEEVNRHGRLSLLVQNWDPDTRSVRRSDDGPFTPGAPIEVKLGYHSSLTRVFEGVICSITAHFPRAGSPVLRIEARSRSILMEYPPRSRQFAEVSDGDVAALIAAEYSLTTDSAEGVARPQVVSDRLCDWDFLKGRAAECGWVVYVRGTELVFREPATTNEPHTLQYGLNVTELHVTQDLTRAVTSVTAAGWDVQEQEVIETEASAQDSHLETGSRPDHETAIADSEWPLRDERDATPAAENADAVEARALGRQRRAALGHVYGTASVVGNPNLRCDQWIEVAGIGARLSGPHYITASRHNLGASGYVTELQLGSPPAIEPPRRPPVGGLSIGIVTSLEDPDGCNRVRVRMPWRGDDGEDPWARVAQMDAGDESGVVFTPSLGQEVVVAPLDGDPSAPIVLGTLFNGVQKPPYTSNDVNYVRAIVTPAGMRIVLDDEKPALSIQTVDGIRHVTFDDAAGSVTIADDSNSMVMDSAGITLGAAKDLVLRAGGQVTIEGSHIATKASGASTFESSGTLAVKAAATLALKGQLININ